VKRALLLRWPCWLCWLCWLAAIGCAPSLPRRTLSQAEADVIGAYAASLSRSCEVRDWEARFLGHPPFAIATLPPIQESHWELRACGYQLKFTLDCASWEPNGERCRAHEWPTPKSGDYLTEQLAAVLAGCHHTCTIRPRAGTAENSTDREYERAEDDRTELVHVHCDSKPYRCGAWPVAAH
jgi:hypothetical protein